MSIPEEYSKQYAIISDFLASIESGNGHDPKNFVQKIKKIQKENHLFTDEQFHEIIELFSEKVTYMSPKKEKISIESQRLESQVEKVKRCAYDLKESFTTQERLYVHKELNNFYLEEFSRAPIREVDIEAMISKFDPESDPFEFLDANDIPDDTKEGQEIRIRMASIMAENLSSGLCESFELFRIKDETARIGVAKLIAQKDGWKVSCYIKNFRITDKKALTEIAKLAAWQNGWHTSCYIKNYDIDDLEQLIEIAKIAAQVNAGGVSYYIQNYGITDEKVLIEIAMLAAKHDGKDLSEHIGKYGIKDQKALIQIAILAAQNSDYRGSSYIKNYSILSNEARRIIFCYAIQQDYYAIEYFKNYDLEYAPLSESQWATFADALTNLQIGRALPKELILFFSSIGIETNIFENDSLSNEVALVRFKEKAIMAFSLIILGQDSIFSEELVLLFKLRNPQIRSCVSKSLIELASNPSLKEKWAQIKLSFKVPRTRLLIIVLMHLKEQGVPHIDDFILTIKNKKSKNNFVFKDALAEQTLLKVLDLLVRNNDLTPNQKGKLLDNLLKIEEKLKLLEAMQALIGIEGFSKNLKAIAREEITSELLTEEFKKAFEETLHIFDIPNITSIFENTFGSFRNPAAIFIYASRLKKLRDKDSALMMKTLGLFIREVLLGSFHESRYLGSPVLDVAFKERPELSQVWKEGGQSDFSAFTEAFPSVNRNFGELLYRSFQERHVDKSTLPVLHAYLLSTDENTTSYESSDSQDDLLVFQHRLISLTQTTDPKIAKTILEECLATLPSPIRGKQLENDLQAWLNSFMLEDKLETYNGWKIVDTDDPCDILLSGTEVLGSCQTVDGDPELNKCLLAYLLDGKNRLLAIKDDSGVINARAIFRLLISNGKPVLFLERIYPPGANLQMKEQLITFAKKRASALGLPLLSTEEGSGRYYDDKLISLGGRAPYEYVDASEVKIASYGDWSISTSHVLQE